MKLNNIYLALICSAFIGVGISYSNFYLFHLMLLIFLVVQFYRLRDNNFSLSIGILSRKFIPTLLFFLIWYFTSLIWTINLGLGLKYIFYICCGTVITLTVVYFSSNKKNLNKVFQVLSVLVFLEIFIALTESFFGFRMPISSYSSIASYFGKDPINYSYFDNFFLTSTLMPPTGFRWNTNDLAIVMVISLPFFLCTKKKYLKIFGILSISTIIILTASRAVFLALLIILMLYILLIKKRVGTLILIWMASAFILIGMAQLRDSSNPRINELANSIEALQLYFSGEINIGGSLEWRRQLIENGLFAFYDTYGMGLGAGGATANQELIGPVAGRFTSMHNFWIELLVEGGVLIILTFGLWISSMIFQLFFISKKTKDQDLKYYSESLLLSLIGFLPAAVAASSTIYFFPMWIMFGFSISVIFISKSV